MWTGLHPLGPTSSSIAWHVPRTLHLSFAPRLSCVVVYLKRLRWSSSTSGRSTSLVRLVASWYVPHALQKNLSSPCSVSVALHGTCRQHHARVSTWVVAGG